MLAYISSTDSRDYRVLKRYNWARTEVSLNQVYLEVRVTNLP